MHLFSLKPRDKKRLSPLLQRLEVAWNKAPDLRLGQLISNAAAKLRRGDPFYIEDEELISEIERQIQEIYGR